MVAGAGARTASEEAVGRGVLGFRTICARATVYASPVFFMRARTRRLRSFWRGIVIVSFGCTTGHSPAVRHGERKGPTIRIRECAPLCLAVDSSWGGVS